jgi:hypothetical protein
MHKLAGNVAVDGAITVCPAWLNGFGNWGFWGAKQWRYVTCKLCLKKRPRKKRRK